MIEREDLEKKIQKNKIIKPTSKITKKQWLSIIIKKIIGEILSQNIEYRNTIEEEYKKGLTKREIIEKHNLIEKINKELKNYHIVEEKGFQQKKTIKINYVESEEIIKGGIREALKSIFTEKELKEINKRYASRKSRIGGEICYLKRKGIYALTEERKKEISIKGGLSVKNRYKFDSKSAKKAGKISLEKRGQKEWTKNELGKLEELIRLPVYQGRRKNSYNIKLLTTHLNELYNNNRTEHAISNKIYQLNKKNPKITYENSELRKLYENR